GFTLLMPSHRWDPGIDGGVVLGKRNHKGRSKGISFRGSSSNLRCCGSGTGNWTSAKWISILAIIPVNSHDYSGTGGLEWLTGKWVLWLVSLNQPQKTELIIETDLQGNHILAGADVRRLIWHEPRIFGRDMWRGKERESSRFFILVLLANDRVGDIGLSMFMFSGYWSYIGDAFIFLVCMLPFYIDWGKEMDVFFRVFVGIWESLDWRVRNIYVRNGTSHPC
ncbi:hypothetical protein HID58_046895, partial [Brassica napus]